MEFGWSAAQVELHARMRELGAEAARAPADERMPILARGGALGLALAAEHGGGGCDLVTTAHAYEGLGATLDDGGLLLAAGAHLFGVALTLARVGSAEARAAWLPRLASGACVATVAVTEAGAGSDVARVEGRCDGSVATGDKRFVTYADRAGVFLFVGRGSGRGLTAALCERGPGVAVGERLDTAGLRGARLAPVRFDACPVALVLGRAGAGMAVFQIAMAYERALVLAFRLGAMERQLEEGVAFARQRGLAGHQAVTHRLAAMKQRLESARLLTYRAAWALDRGERGQAEAALAKWHVADAAVASAFDALMLRGGAGYLEGAGLTAALDDALGGSIHSGTGDVLANIVAAWLGL